jgi:hypothetical protein
MQSLVQSGNPDLASRAMQFEQTVRRLGVRIREDVLASLGPETAIIGSWRSGASIPDLAVVAEVKNAAQARPGLDGALRTLKQLTLGSDEEYPWDESQHLGQTLHTVRIGASKVAPTYVTTESFFILALTPDYAHALLDQLQQGKDTLASNNNYQNAMKRLPTNAHTYVYCNLRSVLEPLYALGQSALSTVGTNEFVEPDKLPKFETIGKHLFPFVSATVADEHSQTTTSFSPFGGALPVMAGAVAASIATPAIIQAQQKALPHQPITTAPKTFSETAAPAPPNGNQTAGSHTPPTP